LLAARVYHVKRLSPVGERLTVTCRGGSLDVFTEFIAGSWPITEVLDNMEASVRLEERETAVGFIVHHGVVRGLVLISETLKVL
jgi:hypothetical protein